MLTIEEMLVRDCMPDWLDIDLNLYKKFSETYLFPRIFRYYLETGDVLDVVFKEWAMNHLWGIHHIDNTIGNDKLFERIDLGLCINDFRKTSALKKRLNDNKDRIRMFACIYHILKTGNMFYVKDGILEGTNIRINYIRSKTIGGKGVNVGMRFEDNAYVPLTLLVDRAVNPNKTVKDLDAVKVIKLEIIETKVIETVMYNDK